MDSQNRSLPEVSNGIFLAGAGAAVLIAKEILLSPTPRYILAAVAVGYGLYLLGREPYNKTPGWTSIAAGAGLALFGGLLSAVSGIAGVGLIIAGAVSALSGLFNRETR